MAQQDKEFAKAMREAFAANEDLRANLYEIADDVLDVAKAIAPEDSGDFRDSLETRRVKYKKMGKKTRVARIVSTDDPAKVATIIHGRGQGEEHGATPAFDVWNRTAAVFNSPAEDDE
ncbi:hypothetical protein [Mycobacterium sp. SMC-4]|uniref:hypothetical protein n=1 Tax=Mycobacterium sp. SMC-4 TaxID=2857059 RepID=UPI0021B2AA5A|nr:hypothetical protein [Mycobacterium sp. SMC-4]UXA17260.1 hypothetical protein KXD98_21345 [Mycobacterium sp. SMC-4]